MMFLITTQVFDAELRLFAEENIECNVTSYPANKGCVDLIAGRYYSSAISLLVFGIL